MFSTSFFLLCKNIFSLHSFDTNRIAVCRIITPEVMLLPVIYIDVLLAQNLYINYFLLRACAHLSHTPLHRGRCLIAALGSSLFSLCIFLPPIPLFLQFLCKLLFAALSVTMAFGMHKTVWLCQFSWFFLCNFLLAGLLLAIGSCTRNGFAIWGNSICYLDFSLIQLILFTTIAYSLLHLFTIFRNRRLHTENCYQIFIRLGEKTIRIPGLADTGNNLIDTFSGTPVIVCSSSTIEPLLQNKTITSLKGYRLIPCTTINAQGLIPLFRPDEICIQNCSTGKSRVTSAMIGIGGTQDHAIFHPRLIL